MKIFITGGSGFVGTHLSRYLLKGGHRVIAIGRSPNHQLSGNDNFQYISADTTEKGDWQKALKNVDAAVNLAGFNIFRFWTDHAKTQIYDSRILTTRNLVEAMPKDKGVTLCSTSAAGYYGNRGDEILKEDATQGDDFLAKVCIDWEKEANQAKTKGIRVCPFPRDIPGAPPGANMSGPSFAAARVSGWIADLLSRSPGLTPYDVRLKLRERFPERTLR